MNSVTVIIPAHNEAARLGPVLQAVVTAAVGPVVVVADACTDGTEQVAAGYAQVVPSLGKTKGTAMALGLAQVATRTVLFIDADLAGLAPEHVAYLASGPPAGGMLVGVRGTVGKVKVPGLVVALPSISGERRLPTAFARTIPLAGAGWQAETRINVAVARAGLPHRQVVLKGVSNPRRAGPVKWVTELAQVSAVSVAHGPELARYVWSES